MGISSDKVRRAIGFASEAVAETLWPTRCAVCDAPGAVLCERCEAKLPFIDAWRACPRCGSAFGLGQCDRCNPVMLEQAGRDELPFSGCASATAFADDTGQVVRAFKDQGERRLAGVMAGHMARYVAPAWGFDAVTYVPASRAAYRRRGFDHAELLAREVAGRCGCKCVCTLDRPVSRDQRELSARERVANLRRAFRAFPANARGRRLLLVDDVLTTGSTLCAATDALLAAGALEIFVLTFAGV